MELWVCYFLFKSSSLKHILRHMPVPNHMALFVHLWIAQPHRCSSRHANNLFLQVEWSNSSSIYFSSQYFAEQRIPSLVTLHSWNSIPDHKWPLSGTPLPDTMLIFAICFHLHPTVNSAVTESVVEKSLVILLHYCAKFNKKSWCRQKWNFFLKKSST